MVHKGESFDGEHPAIVPIDLWDAVQGKMKANASGTSRRLKSLQPSLLVGLVFDGEGRAMTPSHATKPGRRYRYYITRPDQLDDAPAWRVSAYDLCDQLSALLTDQQFVCGTVPDATAERVRQALASADLAAATLRSGAAQDEALLLPKLVSRIDLQEEGVDLAIDRAGLVEALGMGAAAPTPTETLVLTLPATKVRRGHQLQLIIPGPQVLNITPATRDEKLVALIAEAHAARKIILAAPEQSIASIAVIDGAEPASASWLRWPVSHRISSLLSSKGGNRHCSPRAPCRKSTCRSPGLTSGFCSASPEPKSQHLHCSQDFGDRDGGIFARQCWANCGSL